MDRKKIAFITCVNDEAKYEECRYYLQRLCVPDGYTVDMISIRKAPSMASGYNAGMTDSDAKYKVYLHQDVLIINTHFIADILKLFAGDEKLGMLGVIGKKEMGTTALTMMKWDTGRIIYDCEIINRKSSEEGGFEEVASADGLLLATQYDIAWREDVFDGWDFYDFSQCMEFKKAGYKVGIPYQREIWCCHDGLCSKLTAYFDYYERFLSEYAGTPGISADRSSEELRVCQANKEYADHMEELKKGIEDLISFGGKEQLRVFFGNADFQDNLHLREYKAVVCIDWTEEKKQSPIRLWNAGMSASELIRKLRNLKCALKRMEYNADDSAKIYIEMNYSKYAVMEMCSQYVAYEDRIYQKLGGWLSDTLRGDQDL